MYVEDIAAVGAHCVNAKYLAKLCEYGPSLGYIPQPEKCVHICVAHDEPTAHTAFAVENLVARYTRST